MKLKIFILAGILTSFCTLSLNASLIQFEGYASYGLAKPVTTTLNYTEDGFIFAPNANGGTAVVDANDLSLTFPGDTTSWLALASGYDLTMTSGSPFDLVGLDVGPNSLAGGAISLTVTADVSGGGTLSQTFSGLTTDTTESLDWTNLTSVSFSSAGATGLDNICTDQSDCTYIGGASGGSSTPEPGTLLLLGAGLLAIGGKRLRKA